MSSKILKFLMTGALMVLLSNVCYSSAYTVDDASIDALIANAVEVNTLDSSMPFDFHGSNAMLTSSANPWAAFALCWVVGGFGVHRHYMGTKNTMWAIYTFTCGGIFGIVWFVDWVVLLIAAIDEDISKYTGNTKFIMWN